MPRFKVRLEEVSIYETEVEADNAEAAEAEGEEAFVQGDYRLVCVTDRTVSDVREITEVVPA